MTIARKASGVRTPEEAETLLQEVNIFLQTNEDQHKITIKNISKIVSELEGGNIIIIIHLIL